MGNEQRAAEVAILAGGAGTRLRARTGNLPKPMAPLLGKPVLEHLIELCRSHGFTRIALLVHYEHEAISGHFSEGSAWGVELRYFVEQEARGTAGALHDALPGLADQFLVLYGDTYADVDLRAFWNEHAQNGAAATLLLHPNDHPQDSDLVEVDAAGRVIGVHAYPHPEEVDFRNLVNAALYAMRKQDVSGSLPPTGKADIAKHTFVEMLKRGQALRAYVTPEYIKDMGTPERLDKVARDIEVGLPERLSARWPRSAVFLDRDGTLNQEVDHLCSPDDLVLESGAGTAVRALNRSGILAIAVTNQPVVARGEVSLAGLDRVHARLDKLLGSYGAYLDRLYFCPHHPDKGFPGEVAELKRVCGCRKPATGMIDRACEELAISRRTSWMVGDSTGDMLAGTKAGLRTLLVRTGYAGSDGKYDQSSDYVAPDLVAAVDWILNGHPALTRQMLPVAAAAVSARLVAVAGPARAGKSSASQVLKELLTDTGRTTHVVCLDGWLKPVADRPESAMPLDRYNLHTLWADVQAWLHTRQRQSIAMRSYDRARRVSVDVRPQSVGPDDILILEGIPALMDWPLRQEASVRVFVDIEDDEQQRRLSADYAWRNLPETEVASALAKRQAIEVPAVRASKAYATHRIVNTPTT